MSTCWDYYNCHLSVKNSISFLRSFILRPPLKSFIISWKLFSCCPPSSKFQLVQVFSRSPFLIIWRLARQGKAKATALRGRKSMLCRCDRVDRQITFSLTVTVERWYFIKTTLFIFRIQNKDERWKFYFRCLVFSKECGLLVESFRLWMCDWYSSFD